MKKRFIRKGFIEKVLWDIAAEAFKDTYKTRGTLFVRPKYYKIIKAERSYDPKESLLTTPFGELKVHFTNYMKKELACLIWIDRHYRE